MAHSEMVTIEKLELRLNDLMKVKQTFKLKDDAEAVRKGMELAAGRIELESIFKKHEGTAIDKSYD